MRLRSTAQQGAPLQRNPAKARRRWPLWARLGLWALALSLLFSLSAGVGLVAFLNGLRGGGDVKGSDLVAEPRPGERVNLLLLGVDAVESVERSDTIMVISLDPLTRETGVLSIPRDTLVQIPGRTGREKITHAHAYGGPLRSLLTVSELLGVPIHYYVKVDFQGFVALVDRLGGVTVDVEKPMHYSDPYQNLTIDLEAGRQRLNGKKALEFVRYRQDSDLDRIRRQQAFLRAAADEAFRVGMVLRLPRMAGELSRYVETNMDPREMVRIAQMAAQASGERLVMATLPVHAVWTGGRDGGGQYVGEEADPVGKAEAVDRLLRGIDRKANAGVRVRVLDRSGQPGGGQRAAALLRGYGYDVVGVDDAAYDGPDETAVVYAEGDENHLRAQVLARTLGDSLGAVRVYRPRRWLGLVGSRTTVKALEGADLLLVVGPRAD